MAEITRRKVGSFKGRVRFDRVPSPTTRDFPDEEDGTVTDEDGVRLVEYGWLDDDHSRFYVQINRPIVYHTVSTSLKRYQYYMAGWYPYVARRLDWTWEPHYIGGEIGGMHEVVGIGNSFYAVMDNPEISAKEDQVEMEVVVDYAVGEPYLENYLGYKAYLDDGKRATFKVARDGSALKVYDVNVPDGYKFKGWQFVHERKALDAQQEELDAIANAGTEYEKGFVATHAFDKSSYKWGGPVTTCWIAMVLSKGGGGGDGEPGNGELLYLTSDGRLLCRASDGKMLYWAEK